MKKSTLAAAILTGFLLMASAIGGIASVPGNIQKTAHESVRREIVRNITCPSFITENSEANQIRAVVSVDETGKVKVEQINSANAQLKDYVFAQLQNIKIRNAGTTDKFVLIVKFKAD